MAGKQTGSTLISKNMLLFWESTVKCLCRPPRTEEQVPPPTHRQAEPTIEVSAMHFMTDDKLNSLIFTAEIDHDFVSKRSQITLW